MFTAIFGQQSAGKTSKCVWGLRFACQFSAATRFRKTLVWCTNTTVRRILPSTEFHELIHRLHPLIVADLCPTAKIYTSVAVGGTQPRLRRSNLRKLAPPKTIAANVRIWIWNLDLQKACDQCLCNSNSCIRMRMPCILPRLSSKLPGLRQRKEWMAIAGQVGPTLRWWSQRLGRVLSAWGSAKVMTSVDYFPLKVCPYATRINKVSVFFLPDCEECVGINRVFDAFGKMPLAGPRVRTQPQAWRS